jgi:hypothetical protein
MRRSSVICTWLLLPFAPLFAAVDVPTGSLPDPRQPQVAVSSDGTVHVVFGSEDRIYVSTAVDGLSFNPPVLVAQLDGLMLGMRRGPRIAVADGAVVVTAIGAKGNLVSWHSPTGPAEIGATGMQWTGPVAVSDVGQSAREGLHHLTANTEGKLFAVWLDLRHGMTEVFGSRSADGGKTWQTNSLVYRSPGGSVCECCQPTANFGNHDQLHVMWRNSLNGNRDLYFATSSDAGHRFTPATKLGTESWPLKACPMDGGFLAADSHERVMTVWRRGTDVYVVDAASGHEQNLGTGEQPWVAAGRGGFWIAWVTGRPGTLWLLPPGKTERERIASDAADPVIAGAPGGQGPVMMAWEQRIDQTTRIRAAMLE